MRSPNYSVTFNIKNAAAASFTTLAGTMWADNSVSEVYVNGNPTGLSGTNYAGGGLAFGAWSSTFYVAGSNTITFAVLNGAGTGVGENPDGLLVAVPNAFSGGSTCQLACGDGTIGSGETCDDGGTAPNDGCSATCKKECGDGVWGPNEECDDKDTDDGDGCSSTCTIEAGFSCTNSVNLNTASDGAGGTLTSGAPDLAWTWSADLNTSGSPATVIGHCNGAWKTSPFVGADWISRSTGCKNSPSDKTRTTPRPSRSPTWLRRSR